MYRVTHTQWNLIDEVCKAFHDGLVFFREWREETQEIVEVPVEFVDAPAVVEIPAHYTHCWPLDPRD